MKRGALCARAISSGGERFLDAEEVSGSNPLSPTLKTLQIEEKWRAPALLPGLFDTSLTLTGG
jgi:hypothetical protein